MECKTKKIRAKNFTQQECDVIEEKIRMNSHVINRKFVAGDGRKRQEEAWQAVAEAVNSLGVSSRSVVEVKEKWRAMVKKGKKEFTNQRISQGKTGGGPPRPLDPATSSLIDLLKHTPAFSGVPGAGDAETVILSLADLQSQINKLPLSTDDPDTSDINENDNEETVVVVVEEVVEEANAGVDSRPVDFNEQSNTTESVTVTLAPATTNDQVPSTSSACKRKLAPDEQEVEELIKKPKTSKNWQTEYFKNGVALQNEQKEVAKSTVKFHNKMIQFLDLLMNPSKTEQ